jgi:hypothetical protein
MKCRCALCCVPVNNLAMQTDDVQEKRTERNSEIRKQFFLEFKGLCPGLSININRPT